MELCTSRALSSLSHTNRLLNPSSNTFGWRTHLPQPHKPKSIPFTVSGFRQLTNAYVRAGTSFGTSEETASKSTVSNGKESDELVGTKDDVPIEKGADSGSVGSRLSTEESPQDEQSVWVLDKLNLVDSDGAYQILIYGSGALVTLWLASAVVGAIDTIPVFPKLMEVVGLAYSVWFATRYLIFKRNRDELAAKIAELKQQVLGTD